MTPTSPAADVTLSDVLAAQVAGLPCACIQVDEANVPGSPENAPIAFVNPSPQTIAIDTLTPIVLAYSGLAPAALSRRPGFDLAVSANAAVPTTSIAASASDVMT